MDALDHLVGDLASDLDERLGAVDATLAAHFPGERAGRQPVHTVYVPADRFHAGLVGEYGVAATQVVDAHEEALLGLLGGDRDLLDRVRDKLARVPVEDTVRWVGWMLLSMLTVTLFVIAFPQLALWLPALHAMRIERKEPGQRILRWAVDVDPLTI